MCVAILRVVNIWIDTPLEYLMVVTWSCWGLAGCPCEMNVEKRGNMSQIKQAAVTKLDRL